MSGAVLGVLTKDIATSSIKKSRIPPQEPPKGLYDTFEPGDLVYQTAPFLGATRVHYAVYVGKMNGKHMVFDTSLKKQKGSDVSHLSLRPIDVAQDTGTSFAKAERISSVRKKPTSEQLLTIVNKLNNKNYDWTGFISNCETAARAIVNDLPVSTQSRHVSPMTKTLTEALISLNSPEGYRRRAVKQGNIQQLVQRALADSFDDQRLRQLSPRRDASPERGKPCGASHIPRSHKCSKGTGLLTPKSISTTAKIALGIGAIAGGIAITRKWSPADERDFQAAVQGGKKWDVYERKLRDDAHDPEVAELAASRERKRLERCGRTDEGKTLAGRSDAFTPCSRLISERSAFGALYIHPNQKSVFKVPVGSDAVSKQNAIQASANEYKHLELAYSNNVSVPRPIAYNAKSGVIKMSYVQDAISLREFNKRASITARGQVTNNFLREMQRLHTSGIAHRDLHPGNVLVTPSNGVVLIDFGLASSIKHGDRAWAMDDINEELEKVIYRTAVINNFPASAVEIQNWLSSRHMAYLRDLRRGKVTDADLSTGLSTYYNDLRKALAFKVSRPTSTLRPGAQL